MSFILGKKLKMTQIWKEIDVKTVKDKKVVLVKVLKIMPVTVVHAIPNKVTMVRTKARDGYEAIQVSMGRTKKEFRQKGKATWNIDDLKVGSAVTVAGFKEGDKVSVSGLNKGRGFQGVVKRHGFHGGPKTHGQKNRHRAPGSIGSTAFQRVVPGRRMAGHMGMERITTKNLVVAEVDAKNNLLFIRGSVPGMKGTLVEVKN